MLAAAAPSVADGRVVSSCPNPRVTPRLVELIADSCGARREAATSSTMLAQNRRLAAAGHRGIYEELRAEEENIADVQVISAVRSMRRSASAFRGAARSA